MAGSAVGADCIDRAPRSYSSLAAVEAFATKDGSTIREFQHIAPSRSPRRRSAAGQATRRHYHAPDRRRSTSSLAGGGVSRSTASLATSPATPS